MDKIRKILITGCGGMLGSSIYPYLKSRGYDVLATDIDLNEEWLSNLDVRNFNDSKIVIDNFNPDIILHLAALTSLEYCEDNLKDAYDTNYIGSKNIALICREKDIPLVHISTAGVFDGKKHQYCEDDFPNPINVYGKTKLYAEMAIENILKKYYIVRAGWMIGGGKKDKKFVSFMLSQIKSGKKEFKVVDDKFGTITYTRDFAKNLEALFKTEKYGLYHMVCKGFTNRYEIMNKILEILKIDGKIEKVSSDFFKEDFPVERASSERMVNDNLFKIDLEQMGSWEDSLKHYLKNEWRDLFYEQN